MYPVYVVVLFLNFGSFRLIDMSCICEVFQKLTRAKPKVQIFGQSTVPKEREEKITNQTMHINY